MVCKPVHTSNRNNPNPEQGSVLMITINLTVVLTVLAGAYLSFSYYSNRDHASAASQLRAFYLAEAAINGSMADINSGFNGARGSESDPVPFDGGEYWVETARVRDRCLLVATGSFDGQRSSIEAILDPVGRGSGFFQHAARVITGIESYDNSLIDSYDSRAGDYLGQRIRTTPDGRSYAEEGGNLSAGGTIYAGNTTQILGAANAGSLITDAGAYISGSTFPVAPLSPLPPVIVPSVPAAPVNHNQTTGRQRINGGIHLFNNISLSNDAELEIAGPATIVVGDLSMANTGNLIITGTDGPVFMYVTNSMQLTDSSTVSSFYSRPSDFLLMTPIDNTTGYETSPAGNPLQPISMGGASSMTGTIYAPNGTVSVSGTAEVFGAIVAKRVTLHDGSMLHYDEALGDLAGLVPGSGLAPFWSSSASGYGEAAWTMISWRKVSAYKVSQEGLAGFTGGEAYEPVPAPPGQVGQEYGYSSLGSGGSGSGTGPGPGPAPEPEPEPEPELHTEAAREPVIK